MIIVGFSFWADVDKRVDITLMMILVVVALYLGKYHCMMDRITLVYSPLQ
jgi:hypothetical protein